MVNSIISNKYKILEKISEGGMSIVYRGFIEKDQKDVAIKVLKNEVISNRIEDIIHFRSEATTISKLNYDKIVKIYEVDNLFFQEEKIEDSIPYIVMEYINGDSLNEIFLKNKFLSLEEKVELLIKISETLEYIHSHGIIHRDLKPSNVMVIKDNEKDELKIKIIDFGLAQVKEFSHLVKTDEIVGTFGYMSPEQSRMIKRNIDERSDLYSLGILSYQLLTGILPYQSREISSIIHQHIAKKPESLSKINNNIPEVLDKIVLKLMEKEPEKRYQSAKGLLSDLRRYQKGEIDFELGMDDVGIKLSYQSELVGREDEINKLRSLFDKTQKGNGIICFISGEAGKGKTRLVNELKNYIDLQNGIFIEGKCFSSENKIPYLPFKDALNKYLNLFGKYPSDKKDKIKMDLKKIIGELGEIILKINPLLKEIIGKCPPLVSLEPEKENQRFLMVVNKFFQGLAKTEGSLVIFLDDLQWIEEGSISILTEIIKDITNVPILLIGNYRDNEVSKGHKLQKFLETIRNNKLVLEEIKLTNFDDMRMNKFISKLLYSKEKSIKDISEIILNKSKGNPFFAIELTRLLVDSKAIERKEGGWNINHDLLSRIEFSDTIVDTLLRRISLLTKREKNLLSYAALIGRKFDIDLLYNIIEEYSKEEVVEIIDKGVELQLVEYDIIEKGKIFFVHDRIKEAFEKIIDDKNKKIIHLKIAKNIEDKYQNEIKNNIYDFSLLFDLAHHYIESGNKEKILTYSYPAGLKAQKSYANNEAIKYFNIVIDLINKKNDEIVVNCQKNIAEIYLVIGRYDEAIDLSNNIIRYEEDEIEKAKIYKKITHAYFKKGNWKESEKYAKIGLKLLGENLPVKKFGVILAILREFIIHILHSMFPFIFIRRKPNKKSEKNKLIVWYNYAIGWVYALNNTMKFARIVLHTKNLAESKIGISEEMAFSYGAFGSMLMTIHMFKKGVFFHKKAIQICESQNYQWTLGIVYQWLGANFLLQAKYEKGIEYSKKSIEIFTKIGDSRELGMSMAFILECYICLSQYKEAKDKCNFYSDISKKSNNSYGCASANVQRQKIFLEIGDYTKSEEYGLKSYTNSNGNKIQSLICRSSIYLGILYYEQGLFVKALNYLNTAKELYEKNNFIKHYTVVLYPALSDLYIELYKNKIDNIKKINIRQIKKLCRYSLKATKNWITNYGHSLRVNAKYYALIGKNKEAEKYFLQSIEHCLKNGRKYEEAKGYYEYGLFLNSIDREEEAKLKWEKSYQIFKAIDSKVYTKKVADLLGIIEEIKVDKNNSIQRLQYKQKLSSIIKISQDISSILDINILLEKIMEKAIEVTGAQTGLLFIYNKELNELELKTGKNISNCNIIPKFSKSITEKVFEKGEAILTTNAKEDKDLNKFNSVKTLGLKSILCTPIMFHENKIGVCYLDNPFSSHVFTEEELDLLNVFMSQAAISIENASLYEKMQISRDKVEYEVEKLATHILQKQVKKLDEKSSIVYQSQEIQEVINKVNQAIITSKPILITGETGTGKELIAKLIHYSGKNKAEPFNTINCAAVPYTLWEVELFGHLKGSFTDAKVNRKGSIEVSGKGTLFLDEIGEMPYDLQSKLLRVLQENKYRAVGSNTIQKSQCRFVFATNMDVKKLIEMKKFRDDLYYRISVFNIHIPPLRERKDDILILLNHFIKKYSLEFDIKNDIEVEKEAIENIINYRWPGNVRELENCVIRALAILSSSKGDRGLLRPLHFPLHIDSNLSQLKKKKIIEEEVVINKNYEELINQYSKKIILWALKKAKGNKTIAAELLGVKRTTLNYKIKELGI